MKAIKLLFLLLVIKSNFAQLSISTGVGISDFRKNLPIIGPVGGGSHLTGCLNVGIEYALPNNQSVIAVKSVFGNRLHHEKSYYFPDGFRLYADYRENYNVLAGYKHRLNQSRYITPFIGFYAGYWQNYVSFFIHDFNNTVTPIYAWRGYAKMLVFGPSMGIEFGKSRVKGIIEFENLFFSGYHETSMLDERLAKVSIGLLIALSE